MGREYAELLAYSCFPAQPRPLSLSLTSRTEAETADKELFLNLTKLSLSSPVLPDSPLFLNSLDFCEREKLGRVPAQDIVQ